MTKPKSEVSGLRLLCTSLHHFKPETVVDIFRTAIEAKQPILITEFTQRTFYSVFCMIFFAPFGVFILIPFSKSFNLKTAFFSYIIPIIPFIIIWDGIVSSLRSYTSKELYAMAKKADLNNEFERSWYRKSEIASPMVTVLFKGMPKN